MAVNRAAAHLRFGHGCEQPRLATGQTQLTATLPQPLSSDLTTKQWGKVDQAALHKLVICAGILQDAVEAAIGKHNRGRQWDGRVRGGGGGEYNGECLLDDPHNNQ
jgi:hypothetical protein